MKATLLAIILLVLPVVVYAAADVEILSDVSFSKEVLYSGDTMRVYATLRNKGDVDVTGEVSFFIGTTMAGTPQAFSLRTGGVKEEVFVDFTVPDGTFNVRVEITGVNPPDTNTNNNVVITGLSTPVHDKDRDGIVDESDNCPTVANADQKNMDGDTEGDACDADIDGDGLSNEQEAQKGTDPRDADTDDDGENDAVDPTPLGNPPPTPKPAPASAPASVPQPALATTQTAQTTKTTTQTTTSPDSPDAEEISPSVDSTEDVREESDSIAATSQSSIESGVSPGAEFSYEQVRWATFNFYALTPTSDEGYQYTWDFGDGTTSRRKEVVHTYADAGEYKVVLRTTAPDGTMTEDTTSVSIPFFDLENGTVRMLLIVLGLFVAAGLVVAYRSGQELPPPPPPAPKRPRKKAELA